MSHFYGSIPVSARRTVPTARAHSHLVTRAASYQGAIEVELSIDENGVDVYCVRQTSHQGKGVHKIIAQGMVGIE